MFSFRTSFAFPSREACLLEAHDTTCSGDNIGAIARQRTFLSRQLPELHVLPPRAGWRNKVEVKGVDWCRLPHVRVYLRKSLSSSFRRRNDFPRRHAIGKRGSVGSRESERGRTTGEDLLVRLKRCSGRRGDHSLQVLVKSCASPTRAPVFPETAVSAYLPSTTVTFRF